MKDFIDRQALLQMMKDKHYTFATARTIKTQPYLVHATEVVRCKECKYVEYGIDLCWRCGRTKEREIIMPNDYCSRGVEQ